MRRAIAYIFALMTVFLNAAATEPTATVGRTLSPIEKYQYVVVLDSGNKLRLTDSLFYSISRKVIFPVNKYEIPKNSEFRREIEKELMPYMNDKYLVLDRLIIRGAASPEGPYEWNKKLAERRTRALIDLIDENSVFTLSERPKSAQIAEDYVYLLQLMRENNDKDYDAVEKIVNRWLDADVARLKKELQRYDGGKLWKRLLREYFPELRSARVVLVFKKYRDFAMDEPVRLSPEPLVMQRHDVVSTTGTPAALLLPAFKVTAPQPRRELLSVKTNLLLDFAYVPGYDRFCPIPNVAIEYYPLHGHFTYGASFDCPWWQDYGSHKFFQIRNYQLETRYYFRSGDVDKVGYDNGPAFRGWYLQAYGHVGLFGIGFDADRGWMGEGVGGGLGLGYVLPLGKQGHWRLEFGAQFGYFWAKYDPYQWQCPVDPSEGGDKYYYKWTGEPDLFKKRQYRFNWIGPTRVGIILSYDLLYRRGKARR